MKDEFENQAKSANTPIYTMICMFIVGFIVWLYYYPVEGGSLPFWIGIILMGFPGYVFAESIGEKVLSAKFLSKRSSVFRITYAVISVVILGLISVIILFAFSTMVA